MCLHLCVDIDKQRNFINLLPIIIIEKVSAVVHNEECSKWVMQCEEPTKAGFGIFLLLEELPKKIQ